MSLFNFFKKNDEDVPDQTPQDNYYQSETISLPPNFAQNLMELEMQMEFMESSNIEVVQQLNEYYRIAIQYYANVDTKKSQHFHRKLTSLLTNPFTIQAMEKKQTSVKTIHLAPCEYNKNLKHELTKFNSQSDLLVRSMIEGNHKKMEHQNKLIHNNIQSQEDRLQRRLEARSRSKSKRN